MFEIRGPETGPGLERRGVTPADLSAAAVEYLPTGGSLGAAISHLMGRSPQRVLADKLRRARSLLETGEVATTNGQPTGRR